MSLLSVGPLLIARLKDRCPSVKGRVLSSGDLAGVKEVAQVAPALHVLLQGYTPLETLPGGDVRWAETWNVVAVVKHAARQGRAGSQAEAAEPILREVMAALSGWHPGYPAANGPLKAVSGFFPGFSAGYAYFPLAFLAQVVTEGAGRGEKQ
ncbi:MAG: hypothetical protein LBQ81_09770 [Zoogloeaceae bacterium]|nr:hypothetical protein [Zoogloeaceae bacterium]